MLADTHLNDKTDTVRFTKDLSGTDPIPDAAITRAVALMGSGRLHRYGEAESDQLEVVALEREYAEYMGMKYVVALNSCGCALFVALKCAGVEPGDLVLTNAFTLAPVPGAIVHAAAKPVLVEVTDDLLIDLHDLRAKAQTSGARYLMLSHMRGHIADMDEVEAICAELGITLIEDCAHTMGASWNGRLTGTFGAASCFSTQTFKHVNSGEGGLFVTNDEDIAAKAILYSGSYMLYAQHGARPELAVFERWKGLIPNFSMRMSNLAAALVRPQLPLLSERAEAWNRLYGQLAEGFAQIPHIRLPERDHREGYVASSIQFLAGGLTSAQLEHFQQACDAKGIHLKWFGREKAVGFTSTYRHWEYVTKQENGGGPTGSLAELAQTDDVMAGLFDMRIPLSLAEEDVDVIVSIVRHGMDSALGR